MSHVEQSRYHSHNKKLALDFDFASLGVPDFHFYSWHCKTYPKISAALRAEVQIAHVYSCYIAFSISDARSTYGDGILGINCGCPKAETIQRGPCRVLERGLMNRGGV